MVTFVTVMTSYSSSWALLTFLCGGIPTIKVISRIVFGPSAFSSTAVALVCLVSDLLPLHIFFTLPAATWLGICF